MDVKEQILEHAKQEYPNECCGVVIIFKGKERYHPCKNLATEADDNFILSPVDYAEAEDKGEIIKIVHSHPASNPEPSQADLVGIERSGLPWVIVNPLTGSFTESEPSGYQAPLIGRRFVHGVLDCYALIKDYYETILEIDIPDFDRENYWWEKGQNLYVDNFQKAGFHRVDDLREHDGIIIMSGSSTPNHAGVYIGDNKILHHVQHRLSSRDVYGGYWLKNTWAVVRHEMFL